ncbi:ABC transporter H member 2 [Blastocladiella emersonii ATCC 22665]|nr:ABC transporter H member 2 [Blastocladiella emersonii ATCC 22665]
MDSPPPEPAAAATPPPAHTAVDVRDTPPRPIIELKNIHKTYLLGLEGVPALRGVTLSIYPGEWVCIYGQSGGGKSTMLNVIGTIDKPTKGELRLDGVPITAETSDELLADLRLRHLGFVFQSFNLISSMTASENVELPMTLRGAVAAGARKRAVRESLARVGMGHRLAHFPTQLSGGEQQRVTIARAIANHPKVLLLDEPTGDLDTANTHRVIDLLCRLNSDENMTMVMVTHDVYLKNFAHRVVYMRDGKVAREEVIAPAARARAVAELKAELARIAAGTGPAQPTATATTRTATATVVASETRRPGDYETYSSAALARGLALRSQFGATKAS